MPRAMRRQRPGGCEVNLNYVERAPDQHSLGTDFNLKLILQLFRRNIKNINLFFSTTVSFKLNDSTVQI